MNDFDFNIFRYMGGKFYQRDKIIPLFPEHKVYVEVFGGSGIILFTKEPSEIEVYNDINSDIVAFFKILRDNPDEFIYKVALTPYSREIFNEVKNMTPRNDFEKAYKFYVIISMCFGGRPKSPAFGYSLTQNQALTWHKRIEQFLPIINRLKGVIIENLDFREIFERYDSPDTLFYCDPPYFKSEYYYSDCYKFTEKDHKDLALIVKNIEGKFFLNYDDHEEIRNMYKDFNIYEIDRYNCITLKKNDNRSNKKLLCIMNYEPTNYQITIEDLINKEVYYEIDSNSP